jgi:hypothetical protein
VRNSTRITNLIPKASVLISQTNQLFAPSWTEANRHQQRSPRLQEKPLLFRVANSPIAAGERHSTSTIFFSLENKITNTHTRRRDEVQCNLRSKRAAAAAEGEVPLALVGRSRAVHEDWEEGEEEVAEVVLVRACAPTWERRSRRFGEETASKSDMRKMEEPTKHGCSSSFSLSPDSVALALDFGAAAAHCISAVAVVRKNRPCPRRRRFQTFPHFSVQKKMPPLYSFVCVSG